MLKQKPRGKSRKYITKEKERKKKEGKEERKKETKVRKKGDTMFWSNQNEVNAKVEATIEVKKI